MRQSISLKWWFYSQFFIQSILKHSSLYRFLPLCMYSAFGSKDVTETARKSSNAIARTSIQQPENSEEKKGISSIMYIRKKWWRAKEFYYYIPLWSVFLFTLAHYIAILHPTWLSTAQLSSRYMRCTHRYLLIYVPGECVQSVSKIWFKLPTCSHGNMKCGFDICVISFLTFLSFVLLLKATRSRYFKITAATRYSEKRSQFKLAWQVLLKTNQNGRRERSKETNNKSTNKTSIFWTFHWENDDFICSVHVFVTFLIKPQSRSIAFDI